MGAKLPHALVEPSTSKASRDYCRAVKNNDTIKLELVAKVTNMEKFVVIHPKIPLVGETLSPGYTHSLMDFLLHTMVLAIQVD